MSKKTYLIVFGVVVLFSMAFGLAETKTGILVDAACAERMGGDEAKAAKHTVSCSLMPSCDASGFGIVVNGMFLKFDEAGDEKARMLLKNTEETNSFKVQVTGDLDGETLMVKTIEPAD